MSNSLQTRKRTPIARRKSSELHAELKALHEIARALGSAWDVETTLQAISRTTTNVTRMDSCSIYLLDPSQHSLRLKASTGLARTAVGQAKLELGEGITGYAAQHGQPVAVRNAARDPRFKYLPETKEHKFKSLLAVPLISQGHIIGAMNVQTTTYHRYTQREIELLSLIGELAAGALDRAVAHDQMQRQIQELSTLAQVSKAVTAPIFLDEMLSVVVEMAAQIMRARASALLLYDQERDELVMRASHGLSRAHLQQSPLQVHNSLTGRVVMSGKPVVVRDLRRDPLYRNRELAEQEGLLSFVAVPLTVRDKIIGVFNCYMGMVHDFTQREIDLFSTLANQTALALENSNLAMNSMLVREMHHRIKNNLQMVAMLLRLQLHSGKEIAVRDVLHQTVNRIMSIAAVHEALSQEGFRLIDVKALIQQAAHMATQNMLRPDQNIRVTITGNEIRLPSQPATTLAIAANELIQNALEHGFANRAQGQVEVHLGDEVERIILQVKDDGSGLPEGFDASNSLGLQIVETLVTEDLRGEFQLAANANGCGTRALLIVPKQFLMTESESNASDPS
jgi:two-component system, sensor histidine kinase PdtaS